MISPADLETIGRLWLEGTPVSKIARRFDCHHSTIAGHVQRTLRPTWQAEVKADLVVDLKKTAAIEAEGWRVYNATGNLDALNKVQWAIEHRLKVFGHASEQRADLQHPAEVRVAGKPITQVLRERAALLNEQFQQQYAHAERMEQLEAANLARATEDAAARKAAKDN